MFISISPFVPVFGIVLIFLLLILLNVYEFLSEKRKADAKMILIASILSVLAAVMIVFVHRLKVII